MDTDYFFLCPNCGRLTIATGSGDSHDFVKCNECGKNYTAYYIADVGNGIVVHGKTANGKINKVYAINNKWGDELHSKVD